VFNVYSSSLDVREGGDGSSNAPKYCWWMCLGEKERVSLL